MPAPTGREEGCHLFGFAVRVGEYDRDVVQQSRDDLAVTTTQLSEA